MSKRVTPKLFNLLNELANNGIKARELNIQIQEEFEKLGINTDNTDFEDAFGYVVGDGDISAIIDYIESEVDTQ